METKFIKRDIVLVRDTEEQEWRIEVFKGKKKEMFQRSRGCWKRCMLYEDIKKNDLVLVRNDVNQRWIIDVYLKYCEGLYSCSSGNWRFCIPYSENEHLLGTKNFSHKSKPKIGEKYFRVNLNGCGSFCVISFTYKNGDNKNNLFKTREEAQKIVDYLNNNLRLCHGR